MKHTLFSAIAPLFLLACSPQSKAPPIASPITDPAAIHVMVLGAYHMGNPGQDIANVEADDVLTPARQKQLAAIAEALAAFNPTIIAVESVTAAPEYIDTHYANFTVKDLSTAKDEGVQIAYRLANKLGITTVYGIDEQPSENEPDYFPFDKLMKHAAKTEQTDIINADIGVMQSQVKAFGDSQASKTVGELLIDVNTGDLQKPDIYYNMFKYDRGEAQPGAELQSYWFMRNAKIFGKMTQITKPGDRVLIVYGSGHKHWLTHFAANTPGYISVDPILYLKP